MAFAAPQVPAEPSYQGSSWLVFAVLGWVLLYGICFLPFHPCETPTVYFSESLSHVHMLMPFSRTCFAFSSYWKKCKVPLPCHHGRVLLLPLIAPSCCLVSLTTSYGEKGSGQGLSHPLLQHAWVEQSLVVSPGLLCCLALLCPYGNATLTLSF